MSASSKDDPGTFAVMTHLICLGHGKYLLQANVRSTGRWMRFSIAIYIDVVSTR